MILQGEDILIHYGILRKSGRYPWGSGGTQATRSKSFLDYVDGMRKQGLTNTQIAKGLATDEHPFTTTTLRALKSLAKAQQKQADIAQATRLKEKGWSNSAIGRRMQINESSVRALLAPGQKEKADVLESTSSLLRKHVAEKKYVEVGVGVERHMGLSKEKLGTAVERLKQEGYGIHYVKIDQLGTGHQTTLKVLAAPGTPYGEVFRNRHSIYTPVDFSHDGGRTFIPFQKPIAINPRRVDVKYAEQGGAKADGVIYVRPGVKDISLGSNRYAQVRIQVGNGHFLKGMAMYKDDLPPGVDLQFNTNKHDTGNKLDAMKPLKDDPDLPFGSIVHQKTDPKTRKVISAMNIVGTKEGAGEEGAWDQWSRSLSSQFLSKQSPRLAKEQLAMLRESRASELERIKALTNPAVRRKLLEEFADGADSASVHLKAAQMPRQANRVILPINSLKDNEIYAPTFRDGERVVLIRHPHGGVFEIPELTVNNRNREGRKLLGVDPKMDAVGINHKVAQHLSGADFDGDTVLVIPNPHGAIKTKSPLKDLKGFDPQAAFPGYEGMARMTKQRKGYEMGKISNLITDMTIRGANDAELARAVRHSMVVIDAEKHGLNYRQSEIDNGIKQLSEKYQNKKTGGASTLISRAGRRVDIPERKQGFKIDPKTGEKVFTPTGTQFVGKGGKVVTKTQRSEELAETRDAHRLSSGTPIEKIYADHSNALKAMANQARLEILRTKTIPYNSSAKAAYSHEVASLNAKLNLALRNAPLERQAQILANGLVAMKKQANPDLETSELKKIEAQALEQARIRTGARKVRIDITDAEWTAIQAGAISNDKLTKILKNADMDVVKQMATPRTTVLMTSAKKQRAQSMLALGYTQAEIADQLGVSLTTLKTGLS